MEGREKAHTHARARADRWKEITNDWSYDVRCMLASLPISDVGSFKRLIFVTHILYR